MVLAEIAVLGIKTSLADGELRASRNGVRLAAQAIGDAREEPFVGEELAAAFGDLRIEVRTGTKAVGAERCGEGVVLELDGGERVEGSRVLRPRGGVASDRT